MPADHPPVAAVYDRIAAHFDRTRATPWPEVESFVVGRSGAAVDASAALARARSAAAAEDGYSRRFDTVLGDAGRLPLADGTAGLALYVATLHHLQPRARRRASLSDLARVLGPDGVALVSVWSVTHDRFDAESGFDTTVDWTLPDGERVPRYYHVYDPAEFRADLRASRCRPVETFVSSGNCYATVRGV